MLQPIILTSFTGSASAVDPRLLPDGVGVTSSNQQPRGKGDGRPWNAPATVSGVTLGAWLDIHEAQVMAKGYKVAECIRAVCGTSAYGRDEWPSLHEVRSLSARVYRAQGIDVQTLLGHKHAEMTALYEDDRGLSSAEWKRLKCPSSHQL